MSRAHSRRRSFQKPARVDAQGVRERLLVAAMDLVKADGLQGLSQARVAAAAGLRQSHLTYYFPTRKDLLKALVQNIHEEVKEALVEAAFTEGIESVDKVRGLLVQRVREPLMARLLLALLNAAEEAPSLRRWLVEFDQDLIERLRDTLERLGLHPADDELVLLHASFVGAAILGAQVMADAEAGSDRTERVVRLAFDRLVETAARDRAPSLPSAEA